MKDESEAELSKGVGSTRRILAFPRHGIPYTEVLYRAVEGEGHEVDEGLFSGRWLLRHMWYYDTIHFHWPSFFYNTGLGVTRELIAAGKFLMFVVGARMAGKRVVWTAHNLYPHDGSSVPGLHRIVRQALVRIVSSVHVHGASAAEQVQSEFPACRRRLRVIQHGNWIGYYPDTISRQDARDRLGLGERQKVFLFIGLCKPYKNIHGLVRAFKRVRRDGDALIIAGKFQDAGYKQKIMQEIKGCLDFVVKVDDRIIPDDELQNYLRACDIVVLPYERSLTSGAAVLALSFGRPVIAPALGYLNDIIDYDTGLLYDPGRTWGLESALCEIGNRRFNEDVIRRRAKDLDWSAAVRALVAE